MQRIKHWFYGMPQKLTHCEEHTNKGHGSELWGANHKRKVGNSPTVKSTPTKGMAVSCEGPITRGMLETHNLWRVYRSCKANSVNFWQVNSQPVKYEVSLSILAVDKYIYTLWHPPHWLHINAMQETQDELITDLLHHIYISQIDEDVKM